MSSSGQGPYFLLTMTVEKRTYRAYGRSTAEKIYFKLFSSTSVCTGQHRRISKLEYMADFGIRRRLRSFSSLTLNVRRTQLSTVGLPCCCCWYLEVGTVCPNMSRPHLLWLFSEVPSRLFSSGVHSQDFYRSFCFCTAWAMTLSFSGS